MKNIVSFIGEFETALVEEAARHDAQGVVCGHIHHAAMREIDGITYANCGDFVESCSFVAEHHDGRLEVMRWLTTLSARPATPETDLDLDLGEEGAQAAA